MTIRSYLLVMNLYGTCKSGSFRSLASVSEASERLVDPLRDRVVPCPVGLMNRYPIPTFQAIKLRPQRLSTVYN